MFAKLLSKLTGHKADQSAQNPNKSYPEAGEQPGDTQVHERRNLWGNLPEPSVKKPATLRRGF